MCSIAAGFRSSSSTVACIASATDAKKIRPKPFLAGQRRNFELSGKNRGERSFAAGENFSQIIRRAQEAFDAVSGPAFDQARRPSFGHFRALPMQRVAQSCARSRCEQRLVLATDFFDPSIGQHDFEREHMIGSCAVNRARARRRNCSRSFRRSWRANSSPRPGRNKNRAALENR